MSQDKPAERLVYLDFFSCEFLLHQGKRNEQMILLNASNAINVHIAKGLLTSKKTMTKLDPIIAVKDVEASSRWYQSVFGCKSMHGGSEFDVLVTENNEVLICLHRWGAHEHPTMMNQTIAPGNGLILYFRTENMDAIRQNVEKMECAVEADIHLNPNSRKREFSLRDPDGYYLTITELHKYEG